MDTKQNFLGTWEDRLSHIGMCDVAFKGADVLDVGCSMGIVGYEICKHGPRSYHGIDTSKAHLDVARAIFSAVPVPSEFQQIDAALFSPPRKYGVVMLLAVIHHVYKRHGKLAGHDTVNMAFEACTGDVLFRGPELDLVERTGRDHGFEVRGIWGHPRLHPLVHLKKCT